MDLLKIAVLGGIGWYVYTRYLVKKSIGTGGTSKPATITTSDPPSIDWEKVRAALTDPMLPTESKYKGYAVGDPPSIDPDPMYRKLEIPQGPDAPWYDKARNIIM